MKSYLLNLPHRTDRLQQATEQLHSVGIDFERFEAFTGNNRPLAFNKSQYYCIKKAVEAGHERFAIFEDDVAFTEGAQQLIANAVSELPEAFHLLHLGTNIIGMSTTKWEMPAKYSEHLALLSNSWQTHAIVWNKVAALEFLQDFRFYTDEYEKEGLCIMDEWLRHFFYPAGSTFVMRPMVAYQRASFSDINNADADYSHLLDMGNKYLIGL